MHLPEVGGELGLLVAAAGHVAMGRHHLAPRLEAARDLALDGRAGAPALFAAHLLVEAQAQQLHLHLVDLVGLGCGDGGEQAGRGVERPVGVVAGERLLVRPFVARLAQLTDDAALGEAQGAAEDDVPLVPHHAQQHGRIHLRRVLAFPPDQLVRPRGGHGGDPVFAVLGFQLARHKRAQPIAQQFQRLADAFVVGDRHIYPSTSVCLNFARFCALTLKMASSELRFSEARFNLGARAPSLDSRLQPVCLRLLRRQRPPKGSIPKTCPQREMHLILANLLTFDADRVMISVTFTNSLGPTKASTAGPILTSGPCFSWLESRIYADWRASFGRTTSQIRLEWSL